MFFLPCYEMQFISDKQMLCLLKKAIENTAGLLSVTRKKCPRISDLVQEIVDSPKGLFKLNIEWDRINITLPASSLPNIHSTGIFLLTEPKL